MGVLRGGILIRNEQASGTVDSANVSFTTTFAYVPSTLRVFLNGLEQFNPDDFVETGINSFDFINAPIGGFDPDRVTVSYQRA